MRAAVRDGRIARSPVEVKGASIGPSPEKPVATVAEVGSLAEAVPAAVPGHGRHGRRCGPRSGELAALRRDRTDLLHGKVRVAETVPLPRPETLRPDVGGGLRRHSRRTDAPGGAYHPRCRVPLPARHGGRRRRRRSRHGFSGSAGPGRAHQLGEGLSWPQHRAGARRARLGHQCLLLNPPSAPSREAGAVHLRRCDEGLAVQAHQQPASR